MRKLVGLGMARSIPPNLNAKTLVPEKQTRKIEPRKTKKIETKINQNKMNNN
jgi:hypothetical protein